MSVRKTPPPADSAPSIEPPAPTVSGVWLTAGPVREPIAELLLELLAPNQPNPGLREALVEELGRPVKKLGVVLDYLGLRPAGPGIEGARATPAGGAEARARPVARGTRHPGGRLSARSGAGDERPRSGGPRPRGLRPPWRGRAAPRPALRGHGPRGPRPRGDHRPARARDRGLRRGAGTGAPTRADPGSLRPVERRRHGSACSSAARPRPRGICCEKGWTESTCSCCRRRSSRTARTTVTSSSSST